MRTLGRPLAVAMVAFVLAALVLAQGIGEPFVKDAESQSAQWVQSVANGRILLPLDYYGETDRKPPLFYWLAGAVTAASGGRVDETRARVVSLVAAAVIALEVLFWTANRVGTSSGWLAYLFLLGAYGFASRATLALTDMLLTLWIFTAWCLLFPKLEDGHAPRWRVVAIGLVLGLGVLTKGPVAIVLWGLAAVLWLAFRHGLRMPARLGRGWLWAILGLSVAMAACWYVPAFLSGGERLVHIFVEENYGHFAPPALGGSGEAERPIYYIALRVFGGMMPISFLLPALLAAIGTRCLVDPARGPVLYQLTFALAVLIFFTVASAKRDDYILPALPGLAIGYATLFTALKPQCGGGARWAARLRDLAVTGTVVVMAAGIFGTWLFEAMGGRLKVSALGLAVPDSLIAQLFLEHARAFSPSFAGIAFAALAATAALWAGHRKRSPAIRGAGLGLLSLAGVLLFTGALRPDANQLRTLKYAAADVTRIDGGAPLYIVSGQNQELSFYCQRAIPPLLANSPESRAIETPAYVFAYKGELNRLEPVLRERLVPVATYDVKGRAGLPSLYRLMPATRAVGLKPEAGKAK